MILIMYIIAAFLMLVAGFVIFRILYKRDYERQGRLSPLSLILGALIWFAFGGLPMIYGPADWPAVHAGPILDIIGKICLWGGLAILFGAMVWLGLRRTIGQPSHVLKQTGFYRFTRNPQIIGCGLYVIGFAALWPSWYAGGWGILFVAMAHMMVTGEEEHLRQVHGDEYVRYCERVPRYLGLHRESKNVGRPIDVS